MKKDKNSELTKKEGLKGVKTEKKAKAKVEKKAKNTPEKKKVEVEQVIKEDLVKVLNSNEATNNSTAKHKKKQKKNKKPAEEVASGAKSTESNELTEKDLAKIEKKKAKKLAQKSKKQEKKAKAKEAGNSEANKKEPKSNETKNGKKKNSKPPAEGGAVKTNAKQVSTDEKKLKKANKKIKQKEKKDNEEPRQRDPLVEAATVFVGNLPVNTKRIQLVRLFKDYEPVNAVRFRTAGGKTIFKHKHRLEAGALNAYVVLKDAETANRALALNGLEFKSNHLRVTRADKNAHNSGDVDAKHMIFVGNLKYSATEDQLREIFSSCGEIEYVRCLRDGEKGCKGVAYVCFKAPEAVGLALELNETMLDERPIHVERYSAKKLGAKQARDESAAAEAAKKPVTGAKKRLDGKKKKQGGAGNKKPNAESGDKKKKSEFRGVKVDGIKKKPKNKKKPTNQMQKLAKKIAPKAE